MGVTSARRAHPPALPASSPSCASIGISRMPVFDSDNREQLRRRYAEAWAKHMGGRPLMPLEALICDVIGAHPEYQPLVADANVATAFEPGSGGTADNPFLHMGLHIAVREQLSIDRPPGVRSLQRQL